MVCIAVFIGLQFLLALRFLLVFSVFSQTKLLTGEFRPSGLGKLDCAAYYSAVVIQSFLHLHMKRVVYRDLKPENVCCYCQSEMQLVNLVCQYM